MLMTFLFGCNGNDWEEDVEVTDEEYERLKAAYVVGGKFQNYKSVSDIYDRIYDIADRSATESLLEFDEDIAKKHKGDKNFKASDLYYITVEYYLD